MVWSTFLQYLNGQFLVLGGVRALARMVFALLNSFCQCQCQKTDEKIGSKKVFHGGCLTEEVGLKQFGQCPYGNKTF